MCPTSLAFFLGLHSVKGFLLLRALVCSVVGVRSMEVTEEFFWDHAKVHDLGPFLCRDLCLVPRTKAACRLSVGAPALVVS